MGTRSLTRVFNNEGEEIVCLYRQFDGYPIVHGLEVAEFLASKEVVNGIPMYRDTVVFNGPGDLAVQLITHLKNLQRRHGAMQAGSLYLYPVGTDDIGEEFEYHIKVSNNAIHMDCYNTYGDDDIDLECSGTPAEVVSAIRHSEEG